MLERLVSDVVVVLYLVEHVRWVRIQSIVGVIVDHAVWSCFIVNPMTV